MLWTMIISYGWWLSAEVICYSFILIVPLCFFHVTTHSSDPLSWTLQVFPLPPVSWLCIVFKTEPTFSSNSQKPIIPTAGWCNGLNQRGRGCYFWVSFTLCILLHFSHMMVTEFRFHGFKSSPGELENTRSKKMTPNSKGGQEKKFSIMETVKSQDRYEVWHGVSCRCILVHIYLYFCTTRS